MSLIGGYSRGSPLSPVLEFRRCSILISSQPHRHSRSRCYELPKYLSINNELMCWTLCIQVMGSRGNVKEKNIRGVDVELQELEAQRDFRKTVRDGRNERERPEYGHGEEAEYLHQDFKGLLKTRRQRGSREPVESRIECRESNGWKEQETCDRQWNEGALGSERPNYLGNGRVAPTNRKNEPSETVRRTRELRATSAIGFSITSATLNDPVSTKETGPRRQKGGLQGIGKFREFNDLYATLHNPLYSRTSDVCSLTVAPVLPHIGPYGIRFVLLCKSANGVVSSRAFLIDYDPNAKVASLYPPCRPRITHISTTTVTYSWGRGDRAVSTLASHQSEPGSIPGRITGFSHVGVVPDDAVGRRVFSEISRFSRPFIPGLLHTRLNCPSLALKTSLLRAAQISSTTYCGYYSQDTIRLPGFVHIPRDLFGKPVLRLITTCSVSLYAPCPTCVIAQAVLQVLCAAPIEKIDVEARLRFPMRKLAVFIGRHSLHEDRLLHELNFTVLFALEPVSFLHWLLHRCEDTPSLTELHVIGAHNCNVFLNWRTVTRVVSHKVWCNDKRIAKDKIDVKHVYTEVASSIGSHSSLVTPRTTLSQWQTRKKNSKRVSYCQVFSNTGYCVGQQPMNKHASLEFTLTVESSQHVTELSKFSYLYQWLKLYEHTCLKQGASFNATCALTWASAVHVSVLGGQAAVLGSLLSGGADALLRTKGGASALHLAAWRGDVPCAELILGAARGLLDNRVKPGINQLQDDWRDSCQHDHAALATTVRIEQRRNARTGETGDPRENPPTIGIVAARFPHAKIRGPPRRELNPVRPPLHHHGPNSGCALNLTFPCVYSVFPTVVRCLALTHRILHTFTGHLKQIRSESPISTTARTPVLLVSVLELTIVLLVHTTPDTALYFTAFIIGWSSTNGEPS
ncbi:hypothetical protein PR048_031273 [Dryococelus australis]|uniref:Uncharacterized protein n=1 Tax=Dryococelus australis TaxID=614101 RepID=A0ABQ9G4S9_9NEOP|nr:hypothetical protein PR048_031273 [Dryococelus australis]